MIKNPPKKLSPAQQDELRARNVDLIEIPDGIAGTSCGNCSFFKDHYCNNTMVLQSVGPHDCCNLWNAPGVVRKWEKSLKHK
jgi:hypothetical protein